MESQGEEPEVPWLREMVDDDLLGLFSEVPEEVARTARHLVGRAADDASVSERILEALTTSLEHGNDDTQASAWMALVLGELGEREALPVLFQGLGGEDESLQEAAGDALLRMGAPAIDALLDELEDEPSPQFSEAAYRLLGLVGSLNDAALRERTIDFLWDRAGSEAARPSSESEIESLFQASALLGDRRMLEPMDRVLRERFGGKNPAIRDSREMLAENSEGVPLVHDKPPWIEAYRWLFDEDPEASRVKGRRGEKPEAEESPGEESGLASLYWGMNATLKREGKGPLDARKFLGRPGSKEAEEAEDSEELEDSETPEDSEDREDSRDSGDSEGPEEPDEEEEGR